MHAHVLAVNFDSFTYYVLGFAGTKDDALWLKLFSHHHRGCTCVPEVTSFLISMIPLRWYITANVISYIAPVQL